MRIILSILMAFLFISCGGPKIPICTWRVENRTFYCSDINGKPFQLDGSDPKSDKMIGTTVSGEQTLIEYFHAHCK